eukprot:Opistho-1_new@72160
MHQPLVSIIIPLFNAEAYIAEAINSVIKQTYPFKELIIVDDGSTDASLQIAKTYANDWITVVAHENKGAAAARNYGLKLAKGDFIQFLDADDLLSPNKIETQIKLLANHTYYLANCACVHFFDGKNPYQIPIKHEWFKEGTTNTTDFLIKLYGGSLIGPPYGGMVALHAWLIPKDLIHKAGNWNENLSLDDDGELMCRIILAAKGILYANDAVVYYRKHQNLSNISSLQSLAAYQSLLTSAKLKKQYLLNHTNDPNAKIALSRIFMEIAVSFYPNYPSLTNEAENIGKQLDPKQKPKPFKSFPSKQISELIGWRLMKRLSRLKQNLKNKTKV